MKKTKKIAKLASTKAKTPAKKKTAAAGASSSSSAVDSMVPRRAHDVLSRKNPDGTIALLRLDNDEHFYSIDGIAAEFWALIDGARPVSAIKKMLIERFDPPLGRFSKDVESLMKELRKEGLLTP